MDSIWMGIAPGSMATRVLAMHGPSDTILKARFAREPSHPRAVAMLLEAIALWQGVPVRAAFAADERASSFDSSLFLRGVSRRHAQHAVHRRLGPRRRAPPASQ